MDIIYVIGGLIGLIVGGEYLVRGAVAIANRYHISPMIIGLTLVGFGTSTPELVTSVQAALIGAPGIAVGNVVGSNIANVLLIIGIAAVVTPIAVSSQSFRRDGSVLIAATALLSAVVFYGAIDRLIGLGLLAVLIVYLIATLYFAEEEGEDVASAPPMALSRAIVTMLAGLAVTIFAAKFLVDGAISIASGLGVSETIIGLTIVAVGTSMPELVTSVIAARKGQVEVALGNVIGSNIFNILGILGVTAAIKPIIVPMEIAQFDIWIMAGSAVALCFVAITGWRISRTEGLLLLGGYAAYLAALVLRATA